MVRDRRIISGEQTPLGLRRRLLGRHHVARRQHALGRMPQPHLPQLFGRQRPKLMILIRRLRRVASRRAGKHGGLWGARVCTHTILGVSIMERILTIQRRRRPVLIPKLAHQTHADRPLHQPLTTRLHLRQEPHTHRPRHTHSGRLRHIHRGVYGQRAPHHLVYLRLRQRGLRGLRRPLNSLINRRRLQQRDLHGHHRGRPVIGIIDRHASLGIWNNHRLLRQGSNPCGPHRNLNDSALNIRGTTLKPHPVAHAILLLAQHEKPGNKVRNNRLGAKTNSC